MITQTTTITRLSFLTCFLIFLSFNFHPVQAQSGTPTILNFTLVNADDDSDIGLLNDGDTLTLSQLPSSNLNVRANTSPSVVDKVNFDYDGIENFSSEGVAPYALAGDKGGDYNNWTPTAGPHVLTATPKYNGVTGADYTVNFYVIVQAAVDCNGDANGTAYLDDCGDCVGGNTGLSANYAKDTCGICNGDGSTCAGTGNNIAVMLINADTDTDMRVLQANDTLTLAELPTVNLNIRADVSNLSSAASVEFYFNGNLQSQENQPPYVMWGEDNGDYDPWTPSVGTHQILTNVYDQSNGNGNVIETFTVNLFVRDSNNVDCNGDTSGSAYLDDCGVCVDGNTGLLPNQNKDTCGICFGDGSSCGNNGGQEQVDLILINADLDIQIGPLNDGDTMDLSNMSTNDLNIQAIVNPDSLVESVEFSLNGTISVENTAPYAALGASQGDFNIWVPSPGYYVLKVSAYSADNALGNLLAMDSIRFVFVDSSDVDCNGDFSGIAFVDDCGICAGGNTGLIPNADKDTCGVCFGNDSSCIGGNTGGGIVNTGPVCGNFPGGRIAMASDGNNADADDHGATAFAIGMLHYAGLLDKLVFVGHSSLYLTPCKTAYYNWCDQMDSSSFGALRRFGGDTSIVYSFKDDYDDNNRLDESIGAFAAAIDASSPGDSLWIYCAGPMDVVYRAIDSASPAKRPYVKLISHNWWNENSKYGGLSHDWADIQQDFAADGVQFYQIKDQNNSNGNLDFAQESDSASNWDWMTQSGNADWIWLRNTNLDIWLETNKNKAFDISDAGMMYWLISGGPKGGCDTCGARQVEYLFNNPCSGNCTCACDSNLASTGVIVSPSDSDMFAANTTITAVADVADPDSNTAFVEFYVGISLVGVDSTNTYSFDITGLDTGSYEIYVKAVDTCGESSYTDTITLIVETSDCAGVAGGTAYLDDCGICVGGTTGLLPNLDKDTCGVCFGDNLSCVPIDCNGDTLGTAYIDSCGICSSGNTGLTPNASCTDCASVLNGSASLDTCGVCTGGTTGLTPGASCTDCNGDPFGSAFIDSCGVCAEGNTGIVPNQSCTDCAGVIDGTASIDNCGICSGGTTGIFPNVSCTDCNGDIGGSAFIDSCGICAGGNTGITPNVSCTDCAGVVNGTASLDSCGICAGGTTGVVPGASCTDCAGVVNGSASIDNCGVCSGGTTGIVPNASCTDCNGDIGGSAFIDSCGACAAGNTGLTPNASCTDCAGVINGTASVDTCGVCAGGTTGITPGSSCTDCNGDVLGSASLDDCDVCSGGNTGIIPNSTCTDCNGEVNGTAFIDSCGVCAGGNTGVVAGQSCGCQALEVVSFTLMEEGLGGPIRRLVDGDVLYLSVLGSFSVRADICNDSTVGSVVFSLNGNNIQTENIAPYAINGDKSGEYNAWSPSPGTYTLTATPYSNGNAGGSAGVAETVSFTVFTDPPLVDCNGDNGGTAFIDDCGICAGGNTGLTPNASCTDCNGDINGTAMMDSCGVCSGGNTGVVPNSTCLDCAGVLNGTAAIDACGECTGGNTGLLPNASCTDCAGVINGSASIDTCGICAGGSTGVIHGSSCSDCNGDPYGTARLDTCDVCSGGATGIVPNSTCGSCDPLDVTVLMLVDASTGQDLGAMQNGLIIDLATLPLFSVRAETCSEEVESVIFEESGNKIQTENLPPYTVQGDQGANYRPWNLSPGSYSLTATGFERNGGNGAQGASKTVNFQVVDSQASARSTQAGTHADNSRNAEQGSANSGNQLSEQELGQSALEIEIYPNPTRGLVTINISAEDSEASIELYDATGKLLVHQNQEGHDNTLDLSSFAPGVYWIKVYTAESISMEKVYKQ